MICGGNLCRPQLAIKIKSILKTFFFGNSERFLGDFCFVADHPSEDAIQSKMYWVDTSNWIVLYSVDDTLIVNWIVATFEFANGSAKC